MSRQKRVELVHKRRTVSFIVTEEAEDTGTDASVLIDLVVIKLCEQKCYLMLLSIRCEVI